VPSADGQQTRLPDYGYPSENSLALGATPDMGLEGGVARLGDEDARSLATRLRFAPAAGCRCFLPAFRPPPAAAAAASRAAAANFFACSAFFCRSASSAVRLAIALASLSAFLKGRPFRAAASIASCRSQPFVMQVPALQPSPVCNANDQ
jgi:hypothetical protein